MSESSPGQTKAGEKPKTNWRLERIANTLCVCDLTDGFCAPRNKPDCRCWRLARLSVEGFRRLANPCLKEAWGELNEDLARARLNALCDAVETRVDDLTQEHEANG